MVRIELIFLTFSSTCSDVHQHKMGFEYPCKRLSSSKDSTNGAPNVSGSSKVNAADKKLVAPKIIKGSSLNVITGRYKASQINEYVFRKVIHDVLFFIILHFVLVQTLEIHNSRIFTTQEDHDHSNISGSETSNDASKTCD